MNLRKLLGLCEHKWKIIATRKTFESVDDPAIDLPVVIEKVLQCQNCGDIKVKRV